MEDVMDAPMDIGTSSYPPTQTFQQVNNTQAVNTSTPGGE